jgi:hypothetical protein
MRIRARSNGTRLINPTETERRTFYDSESSMEQGFAGTVDRLDEHLAPL